MLNTLNNDFELSATVTKRRKWIFDDKGYQTSPVMDIRSQCLSNSVWCMVYFIIKTRKMHSERGQKDLDAGVMEALSHIVLNHQKCHLKRRKRGRI